jgi:hypothetical protein
VSIRIVRLFGLAGVAVIALAAFTPAPAQRTIEQGRGTATGLVVTPVERRGANYRFAMTQADGSRIQVVLSGLRPTRLGFGRHVIVWGRFHGRVLIGSPSGIAVIGTQ